ncbi:MAG: class I SAM-dependent methyltransferase [Opitutales bacterium]|jgi:ubiquinone/menaquinone biosynthesis C-methylase UbiE
MSNEEVSKQRDYYRRTAGEYEAMHLAEGDEHYVALAFLSAMITHHGFKSVLDVGSGTGRALAYLKARHPDVRFVGIEPVKELREVGYRAGLSVAELVDGDALALPYAAGEFDLVCEFAVLHHVRTPSRVVTEMLRVASRAVFISDCNNFGQGGRLARAFKQALDAVGLWPLANWIKTRGRGYSESEGDGLFYSYSVFNDLPSIRRACRKLHLLNTAGGPSGNLYRTAPHVAVLGLK